MKSFGNSKANSVPSEALHRGRRQPMSSESPMSENVALSSGIRMNVSMKIWAEVDPNDRNRCRFAPRCSRLNLP